jgi:hypothetical protein
MEISRFLRPRPGRQSKSEPVHYDMDLSSKELKAKAAKYRALARKTNDDETANRIFKLAAELEQQARELERGE